MPNFNYIESLQLTALKLIQSVEEAAVLPEGIFRVPASKLVIDGQMRALQQGKKIDLKLDLTEQAALLKAIIGKLQQERKALFTLQQYQKLIDAKNQFEQANSEDSQAEQVYQEQIKAIFKQNTYLSQKIAFNLLHLLSHIKNCAEAKMTSYNLSMTLNPILFEKDPNTMDEIGRINISNSLVLDLLKYTTQIPQPEHTLEGSHYRHAIPTQESGRTHSTVVKGADFIGLGDVFRNLSGDYLKSQILLHFKKLIEQTTDATALTKLVTELKQTDEYKVLKTGQDRATRFFGLKTSSVKAFDKMVKEQERDLAIEAHYKPGNVQ